jgi:predicted unusual protein kinase regulating ubiquinone biosynthesis (AarF/ABC1/UbiB family)
MECAGQIAQHLSKKPRVEKAANGRRWSGRNVAMPKGEDRRARGSESSRLRRVRNELELTQRELADHLGVAASAIAQWESGRYSLPGPVMRLVELYEFEMGISGAQAEASQSRHELAVGWSARTPRAAAAAVLWLLFFGTLQEGDSHPLLKQVRRAALRRYASLVGELKGLALKLGQMTSYMEYVLPDHDRSLLASQLVQLKPMPRGALVQVFVREFGKTPRQLFAEWSPEPFATASIGQVHEARLTDGRQVAVKVQYPRIVEALKVDLGHAAAVDRAVALFLRAQKRPVVIEEMRARFLEECDYALEARRQARFAELFAHRSDIRVPAVVPQLSTGRILTTELMRGATLEDYATTAPVSARNRVAATLLDFYFEAAFVHGIYNTDPNPGNYLFGPDHVAFLDFGRVKEFSPRFVEWQKRIIRSTLERDRAGVRAALVELGTAPDPDRFDFDAAYRGMLLFHRAFLCDEPFTFTPEYLRKMWRVFIYANPNMTRTNYSADMVFLNQFYFGVTALLVRLRARLDYRPRMLDLLYRPGERRPPPFTKEELRLLDF